jgi:hypothetical protein
MVAGIIIGGMGFACLAFSTNIWVFVLGMMIFSIGEMTAHPKYYSYIGMVAPADKTAVYMGYAFLYGVIGSLIGSNLGGVMYESMLKPLVGKAGVQSEVRLFWYVFIVLDIVAVVGLFLYNRYCAVETPAVNAASRKIMIGVYAVLIAVGGWFFYYSLLAGEVIAYKTLVQAVIMLLVGGGGMIISFRPRT